MKIQHQAKLARNFTILPFELSKFVKDERKVPGANEQEYATGLCKVRMRTADADGGWHSYRKKITNITFR